MNWKLLSDQKPRKTDEVIEILLNDRGIKTKKEIDEFLSPKNPSEFSAEDLEIDEKEIKKATDRIQKAIDNSEGIIVYGDYDADGICATAILWETLYELSGKNKNILPYIPERVSEGYGLNCDSIKKLKAISHKLGLIITVDHGITAAEKIQYANELGIDIIVCDHHQIGVKKPDCEAIVHTEKICASAISWFLSNAISYKLSAISHLDLVAIATIADLEPLIGVNRSFAKYGLEALRKTDRCGLLAIFNEAGLKKEEIDAYHIGYIIAPRLNAMGRMEHAFDSLRLLCTKDCIKAKNLADKLGLTNKERQLLTEETVKQAKVLIAGLEGDLPKFLVVDSDQYEEGIIGLVAGKLVEEYYRPAVVISRGEKYPKASARSVSGFNIIEAIRTQSDLLVDAGGHPTAAGFTIETAKIEILKQKLSEVAERQITKEMMTKTLKIDLELPIDEASIELWNKIQILQPFGLGNPEPTFFGKVKVKDFRVVGSGGKHLKLLLAINDPPARLGKSKRVGEASKPYAVNAIASNMGNLTEKLKIDHQVEVAYNMSLNIWNAAQNIELKIKDITWPNSQN